MCTHVCVLSFRCNFLRLVEWKHFYSSQSSDQSNYVLFPCPCRMLEAAKVFEGQTDVLFLYFDSFPKCLIMMKFSQFEKTFRILMKLFICATLQICFTIGTMPSGSVDIQYWLVFMSSAVWLCWIDHAIHFAMHSVLIKLPLLKKIFASRRNAMLRYLLWIIWTIYFIFKSGSFLLVFHASSEVSFLYFSNLKSDVCATIFIVLLPGRNRDKYLSETLRQALHTSHKQSISWFQFIAALVGYWMTEPADVNLPLGFVYWHLTVTCM